MKMILDSKDIEALIQEKYDGVESIKVPENIEIEISIDSKLFYKQTTPNVIIPTNIPIPKPELTPDELQSKEASQGAMASGGERRNLQRF